MRPEISFVLLCVYGTWRAVVHYAIDMKCQVYTKKKIIECLGDYQLVNKVSALGQA